MTYSRTVRSLPLRNVDRFAVWVCFFRGNHYEMGTYCFYDRLRCIKHCFRWFRWRPIFFSFDVFFICAEVFGLFKRLMMGFRLIFDFLCLENTLKNHFKVKIDFKSKLFFQKSWKIETFRWSAPKTQRQNSHHSCDVSFLSFALFPFSIWSITQQ